MTTAIAPAAVPAALPTHDIAQLRGITDEWVRVSLVRDWDALTAMFTDDVVFLPPDAPIVVGKEAVRAFLEAFPRLLTFSAAVEAAEGRPDLAWGRGTFQMTVELAPAQTATMTGKWAATYRKRADGGWLVASDTWNLDAPLSTG